MKTEAQLEEMSIPELKAYGDSIGVKTKGNLGKDKLKEMILDKQSAPDVVIPEEEPVELQGREFAPPEVVLESGAAYSPAQIVAAAQRDSGLTPEEWNEADDKQEAIEQFVEELPVVNKPEPVTKHGKAKKEQRERIEKALKPYVARGLAFDVDDTVFTISYRGLTESGNLSVPDYLVARQADLMLRRFNVIVE